MADVFSKQKRSEVMARIRSRGNARTELALVALLRAEGITGWRRQVEIRGGAVAAVHDRRQSAGAHRAPLQKPIFRVRPDFVFRRLKLALFVDGCFWHGCPIHATKPKGNAAFWRRKLAANQARDKRVNRELKRAGWRVLRVWEHALRKAAKSRRDRARLLRRIGRVLKQV